MTFPGVIVAPAMSADFDIEVVAPTGTLRHGVILSDVHYEERDPAAWRAALAYLKATSPDEVILNGDFLELASVSLHPGAIAEGLESDFAQGRAGLAEILAAAPRAQVTYLEGNHETRLHRYLVAQAPGLIGSLSVVAGLRLASLGIPYIPEGRGHQPILRGSLRIIHGHQAPASGVYHAAKMANLYGAHGQTVAYGHLHRIQSIARPGEDVARAQSIGCLRTISPEWEHGRPSGWEHGIGIYFVRPDGITDLYAPAIRNGSFAFGGHVYG